MSLSLSVNCIRCLRDYGWTMRHTLDMTYISSYRQAHPVCVHTPMLMEQKSNKRSSIH